MKSNYKKPHKMIALIALIILVGILSTCALPKDALKATGGLGTEEPATTEAPAETIPTDIPTLEPIPATFGHIVFVSNRDGHTSLYKTTPDGLEQIRLTTSASEDISPVVSPDGTQVAFVSTVDGNMDIYVLELNTLAITRITDASEKDSSPSWSPSGGQLVFESFRDGNLEIYIANRDGSNQIRLTNDPAGDSNPVWSPVSNNEIAFVSNRFGNSDILLLTPNGIVSTLTTNSAPDSAPAWSPDGSSIAFKTSTGELANLCLISRDGLNQRCITGTPLEYGSPVWSPDGLWIAANLKQTEENYAINLFNIVDGNVVQLFSDGVQPRGTPVWSPEGARLVFQAQSNGDMELYVVTVKTNEFIRLTSTIAYDGEPVWTER